MRAPHIDLVHLPHQVTKPFGREVVQHMAAALLQAMRTVQEGGGAEARLAPQTESANARDDTGGVIEERA